jgi:6-pyruvoyl-tetrahydropterin synthase
MRRFIIVRTSFEGWHFYKDAPIEVGFLRNLHRHIFHVEVKINVKHDNRALEFFMVKHFLNEIIKKKWPAGELGQMSCEMVAEEIYKAICIQYRMRSGITVIVSEDLENAGGIET